MVVDSLFKKWTIILLFLLSSTIATAQPPIAYYPFNGNANDESGNGNDGTLGDGSTSSTFPTLVQDRFSRVDSTFSFDGGDHIELPSTDFVGGTDILTVSWWMNPDDVSGVINPFTFGNFGSTIIGGDLFFNLYFSSIGEVVGTTTVDENDWQFFALTYDGANTTFYKNGEQVDQVSKTGNVDLRQPVTSSLGTANIGGSGYYTGDMDDIRIYNRALSAGEIEALYTEDGWTTELSITSFSPSTAKPGASVTISGTGFFGTPSGNDVYFGAAKATVTAASNTELTVTVPSGAMYAPITVWENGEVVYSSDFFLPTFDGVGTIDANAFAPKVDIPVGTAPEGLGIGDFNLDGLVDITTTSTFTDEITILRNTSTGQADIGFATETAATVTGNSQQITIGDIDMDGRLDIISTDTDSELLSIFTNTSTQGANSITFSSVINFDTDFNPNGVDINDADGDGKPDVITVNNGGTPSAEVFTNSSAGFGSVTMTSTETLNVGTNPLIGRLGDTDGDGLPDLVIGNSGDGTIAVYRNNTTSGGAIDFANTPLFFGANLVPSSVALGDVDGDGKLDIVATNQDSDNISILRNLSPVGGVSFDTKEDFPTGNGPSYVALGDLDGDGQLDMVTANLDDNTVSVFTNTSTGAGDISFSAAVTFAVGATPYYVAISDLDNDDAPEIITVNQGDNSISILRNELTSDGLIAYYPFNGNANDESGNGNDGTWDNDEVYVADRFGNTTSTASFDGVDDYIDLSTSLLPASDDFSFSGWFSTNSVGENTPIFSQYEYPTADRVQIVSTENATVRFSRRDAGDAGGDDIESGTNTQVDTWHHISVVRSGSDLAIYLDNQPTTSTFSGNILQEVSQIGARTIGGSSYFDGLIDDIRIYNRALSESEITDLYTEGGWPLTEPFITTWETTDNQITIPTTGTGYNYYITWTNLTNGGVGDGSSTGETGDFTITGLENGSTYQVEISGDFPRIYFNNGNEGQDITKIQSIDQWGDIEWTSMAMAFDNCSNLVYNATDAPDLSSVTDMTGMFRNAGLFDGDLSNWDVSNVQIYEDMFWNGGSFNGNVSNWEVGNAQNMRGMFGRTAFNQSLDQWDVSNVTNMIFMFDLAGDFDQSLGDWDISSVINMGNMLDGSGLSTENYDATLIGWSQQSVQSGVTLGAAGLTYCTSANAKSILEGGPNNWTITDAGQACTDLVAFYPFNGNANDESGNGNDGTVSVATLTNDRFGNGSSAYIFDGAAGTNFITVADDNSLDFATEDFTLHAWINTSTLNEFQRIISKGSYFGSNGYMIRTTNSGQILFELNGVTQATSTQGLADGQWRMVTVTHDRDGNTVIYLDGAANVTVASNTTALDPTNTEPLRIGSHGTDEEPFYGEIDDVRIYNRVLSAQEVFDLYTEGGWPFIPTISSFSPLTGTVGSSVTITGTNFDPTPASNIVYFGGAEAEVTAASETELTVTVPLGSAHDFISVLTNDLIAYSPLKFSPSLQASFKLDANSFAAPVNIVGVNAPRSLRFADLDGDGKLDMATISQTDDQVAIFRSIASPGVLDGTSFESANTRSSGSNSVWLDFADIDRDGKLDLISNHASGGGSIGLYRNNASAGSFNAGSFDTRVDISLNRLGEEVSIGDLDLDGQPDIVTTSNVSSLFQVLQNTTTVGVLNSGSFSAAQDFNSGPDNIAIAVGDLDGDGLSDVVTGNRGDFTITTMLNETSGSTLSFGAPSSKAAGANPWGLELADIDGDGNLDIIASSQDDNELYIYHNASSPGSLSFGGPQTFSLPSGPFQLELGDLSGDGKPEIVVASTGGGISVFQNQSSSGTINSGSLGARIDYPSNNGVILDIGDLDGDGANDIAVTSYVDGSIALLRNALLDGPLAQYDFTAGSTADLSGYSFDATANGGPAQAQDRFLNSNQAYSFDGSDDNMLVSSFDAEPDNITIVNWFKFPEVGAGGTRQMVDVEGVGALALVDQQLIGVLRINGSFITPLHPVTLSPALWYMAALTFDGNDLDLYMNGVLVASNANPGNIDLSGGTNNVIIGTNFDGTLNFNGELDDLKIYGRALDATEVRELYNDRGWDVTNINEFSLAEQVQEADVDTAANTVDIFVAFGTDLTTTPLTPTFTLSTGATARIAGAVQTSGATANDYTNPVTYEITSEDGLTVENWTVTVTVDNGIVVDLPFSGDALDLSGKGNDGTLNGGVTLTEDRFSAANSAYLFDGSTGFIDVSGAASTEFSASFWFKANSITTANNSPDLQSIYYLYNTEGGTTAHSTTRLKASKIDVVQLRQQGPNAFESYSEAFNDDVRWHHMVVTGSPTQATTIYVDNELQYTGQMGFTGWTDLVLGYSRFSGGTDFFDGVIDDVKVFSYVIDEVKVDELYRENGWPLLSEDTDFLSFSVPGQSGDALIDTDAHTIDIEVQFGTDPTNLVATFELSTGATATISAIDQTSAVTNNDFTNPLIYQVLAEDQFTTQSWLVTVTVLPDMIAYYPFNGNANDASGNGNNGTPNGGVTLSEDRFGNANRAFDFDGVDDEIVLPSSTGLNEFTSKTNTISIWAKLSEVPAEAVMLIDATGPPGDQRGFRFLSSLNPTLKSVTDNGAFDFTSSSALDVNQWHHLVAIVNESSAEIYIDGISVGSSPINGVLLDNQLVKIGNIANGGSGSNFFNGGIDDVRIYGRALTQQEIDDLYNEGGWPLTPDGSESILARSGTGGIEADGTSYETLTVQVKDETGKNIPTAGIEVQFTATEGTTNNDTDIFIDPNAVLPNASGSMTVQTDGTGLATVRLANSEIEQLSVQASIDTDDDNTPDAVASGGVTSLLIDYIIGSPSVAATGSVISGSGPSTVADGTSAITVSVQVKDVSGRNINQAGIEVQFVTTGSASLSGTASSTIVTTDGQGQASVEVTNTVIEAVSVRALIDVDNSDTYESPAEEITSGGSSGAIPITFTADPTSAMLSNVAITQVNKANGLEIELQSDETGTIYWIINLTGVFPEPAAIKSATAATNGSGSFNVSTVDALVQQSLSGTSLSDSTRYQLYLVHEDANGNFSSVENLSWTADATAPKLASASINPNTPTTVSLVFTEELVFDVVSGITLTNDDGDIIPFSSGASGPTLNFGLSLSQEVTGTDTLFVNYDQASGAFSDVSTNTLASFVEKIILNEEATTEVTLDLSLVQRNQANGITLSHTANATGKFKWLIIDSNTTPILAAFSSQNTGGFGIDSVIVGTTTAIESVIQATGLTNGTTYYLFAIAEDTDGTASEIQSVSWVADGVAPEITNATVTTENPTTVSINISEDVTASAVSGLTISDAQGVTLSTSAFTLVNPTLLEVVLNRPIVEEDQLTLSYTPTGNEIVDAALNDLAAISDLAVTNNVVTIPPVLSNVEITKVTGVESIDISYQVDKAGTIHWIAAPTGGSFTTAQIKAGTGNNSGFSSFEIAGVDVLESQTIAPMILANNQMFDIHLFAEDEAGVPSAIEIRTWEADGKAPSLVSAEVLNATPSQITVVFDEALVYDNLDGFSLDFIGSRLALTSVEAIDEVTLALNLNGSLIQSDRVLLSYSPSDGSLRDSFGNIVRIIEDFEVDINVLDPPADLSNLEIVNINELESIDLQYQSTKIGKMYWVMTNNAAIPTEIELKTGGSDNFGNGVFDITLVDEPVVENLPAEGLQYLTAYYVHLVQEDDEGNLSDVSSLPWITPKGPPTVDPLAVTNIETLQIDLQYSSSNEESLVIHYAIYNEEQPNITTAAILNGIVTDDGDAIQFASFDANLNGEYLELIVFANELSSIEHYIYAFGINEIDKASEIASTSWLPVRESGTDPLIRNLITPNGDGQNDRLYIENLELYPGAHTVTLTDRNGKPLITINDFSNDNISVSDEFARLDPGPYICVLVLADGSKFMESITILKE